MTNYYLLENDVITQSSNFKFDENCLVTEEEIVRDELSGQLYLKNRHDELVKTDAHKAEVIEKEKEAKKIELISKLEELDSKRVRASLEPSVKDEATGQTWLGFYNQQIADLRVQLATV